LGRKLIRGWKIGWIVEIMDNKEYKMLFEYLKTKLEKNIEFYN
jgi:hypothetical protein